MINIRNIFCLSAIAMLTACGGSSNDSPDDGTSMLPNIIIGPIAAVDGNTLTINGRNLDITDVAVQYNTHIVSAETLVTGMNVKLNTDGSEVTAIALNPDIAGKVTAVSENRFTINGIEVFTGPMQIPMSTNQSLAAEAADIAIGDYVLVSSQLAEENTLRATAVSQLSIGEIPLFIEVEGMITAIDPLTHTLTINNQQIDYASADIEDGSLTVGQWVEVFGRYNNVFVAEKIRVEDFEDSAETEIYGMVTWVNDSQSRIELSRKMHFDLAEDTEFDDGVRADLAVGKTVELTLRNVDGVTKVIEVEFEDDPVSPAPVLEPQFELTGTMTLLDNVLQFNGFEFVITDSTDFDDNLSLPELDGAALEIEGIARNGNFIVLEIERADEDDTKLELEGLVTAAALWGYTADDNSLDSFEGTWVAVECDYNGAALNNCQLDD